MIYGYCRISTKKQSIERQIRNIKQEFQEAVIITEEYTGTKMNRKEWNKLYSMVKENDTIVFDSVSRMSRNAEEGFEAYQELFNKGVNLVFIKEPFINTSVYKTAISSSIPMTGTNVDFILNGINAYLLELAKEQIKLAFLQSEKEVNDLHRRTVEGLMTARLNGKQIGNKAGSKRETKRGKEVREAIKKYSKEFEGTLDDKDVMKLTGTARNTYYKYKKELKEGN